MNEEKIMKLFNLGQDIKKQLKNKNAQQQILRFGQLITNNADKEIIVDYLLRIINGYGLSVDLQALAETINTSEYRKALQSILLGLLSK